MRDLHSALKTTIIQEANTSIFHSKHVRLQYGKDDFLDTLHVRPLSYSTAGLQSTDLLSFIGFARSPCAFHWGECYVRVIPQEFDLQGFTKSATTALSQLKKTENHLKKCGLNLPQPEGLGFFYGNSSEGRRYPSEYVSGNGHVAPKIKRIKDSEDQYFYFIFTWIEGADIVGWTTHYRAKHIPLSSEFTAALNFIGGFTLFAECPEFDFESCYWRFTSYEEEGRSKFDGNSEHAHHSFDAHAAHFSLGLKDLLSAHVELEKHGISFLKISPTVPLTEQHYIQPSLKQSQSHDLKQVEMNTFDVAISFAGTERKYAKQLAELISASGFKVFYDDFYPEQLWGKDLVAFFDRIYRKASKYCVMFISAEYENRIWTTHERRSAQARALHEKGREYILPIRVDQTELEGLQPTIGYLPLDQYSIEQIAELLIKKLKG